MKEVPISFEKKISQELPVSVVKERLERNKKDLTEKEDDLHRKFPNSKIIAIYRASTKGAIESIERRTS